MGTENANDQDKQVFFGELERMNETVPQEDMIIIRVILMSKSVRKM